MKKRILVVEDQEDNRRIMRDLLTNAGFDLIEAANGEEGVRMAKAGRPDLILMDIQMPVLDGYEATRRIKALPEFRDTPIIVVTSYALERRRHKGPCGGSGWLCRKAVQPTRVAGQDTPVPALRRANT